MRQVEIVQHLSHQKDEAVHPGTVTALVKPLFECGVITRTRPRGRIELREQQRLTQLLQAAGALTVSFTGASHADAERGMADLRRVLVRPVDHLGTEADKKQ